MENHLSHCKWSFHFSCLWPQPFQHSSHDSNLQPQVFYLKNNPISITNLCIKTKNTNLYLLLQCYNHDFQSGICQCNFFWYDTFSHPYIQTMETNAMKIHKLLLKMNIISTSYLPQSRSIASLRCPFSFAKICTDTTEPFPYHRWSYHNQEHSTDLQFDKKRSWWFCNTALELKSQKFLKVSKWL